VEELFFKPAGEFSFTLGSLARKNVALINRLKALKKRFLRQGFQYCIFHTLPTEFFNFSALKMNKGIKK